MDLLIDFVLLKPMTIFRVKVPNNTVDDTYGGYHLSYEVKKLMYEKGCIYFDVYIGFLYIFYSLDVLN